MLVVYSVFEMLLLFFLNVFLCCISWFPVTSEIINFMVLVIARTAGCYCISIMFLQWLIVSERSWENLFIAHMGVNRATLIRN